MEALSDRQVPKSWSQQPATGKLLQTAHRLKHVETEEAPERQEAEQSPRAAAGSAGRKRALGWAGLWRGCWADKAEG